MQVLEVQAQHRDRRVVGTLQHVGEAVRRDAQIEQGVHVEESQVRAVTCRFHGPFLDGFAS